MVTRGNPGNTNNNREGRNTKVSLIADLYSIIITKIAVKRNASK
jgi:hypothetical protein